MPQFVCVILVTSALLALAFGLRAVRIGRSTVAVATLAVALALAPWLLRVRIEPGDALRAPLKAVVAVIVLHAIVGLLLRILLRRTVDLPADCPLCGQPVPRIADGTLAPNRPAACPECGTNASEWIAVVHGQRMLHARQCRLAAHALLGGVGFALLAMLVVPMHSIDSEAPYRDLLLHDGEVHTLRTASGEGNIIASTSMSIYSAGILHVFGAEDERAVLIRVDGRSVLGGEVLIMNGQSHADAVERVGRALANRGLDRARAGEVLDAALIAVGASDDGERITLAPLHVGRWNLDLDLDPRLEREERSRFGPPPTEEVPMRGWQLLVAAIAIAGAWAVQPPPLSTPAGPHRRDRSRPSGARPAGAASAG